MSIVFFDLMTGSVPGHLVNILTIVAAIPAMARIKTEASLPQIYSHHQAYAEDPWDNWTANHSPQSNACYSDDPLLDDGAATVVRDNALQHRKDMCVLNSSANRIVSNDKSWLESSNSNPLTLTNTTCQLYGRTNPST